MLKRVVNFLFESFGISAVGETPEERRWREFREQRQDRQPPDVSGTQRSATATSGLRHEGPNASGTAGTGRAT